MVGEKWLMSGPLPISQSRKDEVGKKMTEALVLRSEPRRGITLSQIPKSPGQNFTPGNANLNTNDYHL